MSSKSRRRWFGATCLLTAIAMLVAGVTVLEGAMAPLAFVGYWLACLLLTALAAGTALIDASRVRAEQREEQRALIENTLKEVERERLARTDVREQ